MKHIKPYFLIESNNNHINLIDICDSLIKHTKVWKTYKSLIDPNTKLFIDTRSKRYSEAHFNPMASTKEIVIIEMRGFPRKDKGKGTLAHELVHSIQWITGNEGDLMFINDITRELDSFSDEEIWKKLMFAIYISCPQETESWEAEIKYHREEILNDMIPWMESFDPKKASEELSSIKPNDNPWGLESFEELPNGWAESYENYDEVKKGSDIPGLSNLTLEEFLRHYDKEFKKCSMILRS